MIKEAHVRGRGVGESGRWMRPSWIKRKERRRGHVKEVKFRGGYSQGISPFQ